MDLIVDLGVSEEALCVCKILLVIEEGYRVLAGHGVAVADLELVFSCLSVVPP